jgi:hypothetical protein
MSHIKTLIREQNGTTLEAKISKTEHRPYQVDFFINGKFSVSETYDGMSIHYVERAAENWLNGIKVLNG